MIYDLDIKPLICRRFLLFWDDMCFLPNNLKHSVVNFQIWHAIRNWILIIDIIQGIDEQNC